MCEADICRRWTNKGWLLLNETSNQLPIHQWNERPRWILNGTIVHLDNNCELIFVNPHDIWTHNIGHDNGKTINYIKPAIEYQNVVENLYSTLKRPIIATHLRDLSDGDWEDEQLAKIYTTQVNES